MKLPCIMRIRVQPLMKPVNLHMDYQPAAVVSAWTLTFKIAQLSIGGTYKSSLLFN